MSRTPLTRRDSNPWEEPLHDETDQVTQSRRAHGDNEKFSAGNKQRLAGEVAFEGANDE